MLVIMAADASAQDVAEVVRVASEETGGSHRVDISSTDGRMVVSIHPDGCTLDSARLALCHGVVDVEDAPLLYKLAGKSDPDTACELPTRRVVEVPFADATFGGTQFVVMAGPCAVENEADLLAVARAAKQAGAKFLRGGAYKPRTSPYSFKGLGKDGLDILATVRQAVGIGVVTEAMEPATVELVAGVADMIQIGSRSMQNFPLLREVGRQSKPVLLKRGMSATLEEWLGAAEYVLSEGNPNVVLCERGIRTFSRHSRHTLDIGVIPAIRERSDLPVVVDPSHSTGSRLMVPAMSRAAIAAGADGLLVEVHTEPSRALVDGFQMISLDEFSALMTELERLAPIVGRTIH